LASWKVAYVSIQCNLKFAEGLRLNLACVLQFSYPVRFLFFKASDLRLNLNSLLVFFVDTTDQVEPLLLTLQGLLLGAQLLLLLFLPADHVLHGLGLELVGLLLHVDHLLMLHALLLESIGLSSVTIAMVVLIEPDRRALVVTIAS